jgi:hypothetical protein
MPVQQPIPRPPAQNQKPRLAITCPTSGQTAEPLSADEIDTIIDGYRDAAQKAVAAGVDILEIQGGHGYLMSQFLNGKSNQRSDIYGENRLLFAEKVLVIYGGKFCYVNVDEPTRLMQNIIEEQGPRVGRIQAYPVSLDRFKLLIIEGAKNLAP